MNSTNWIVIAVIAGLAAAALHAAARVPTSLIAVFLFNLAPLPMFIAGLGWGVVAAAVAALVGTVVIAVLFSLHAGFVFAGTVALIPLLVSYLAMISRPADNAVSLEGEASASGRQWYPEGRLLLWMSAIAGALVCLVIIMLGPDAESFYALIRKVLNDVLEQVRKQTSDQDFKKLQEVFAQMVYFVPPMSAATLLLAMFVDFWAATRFLAASNNPMRPWSAFSSLAFPRRAGLALALACLATMLPGTLGVFGWVFTGALMTAFALIGLAVLHALFRDMPARALVLFSLYAALAFFSVLLVVPLVMVALADMIFGFRQRLKQSPSTGPD